MNRKNAWSRIKHDPLSTAELIGAVIVIWTVAITLLSVVIIVIKIVRWIG